MPLYEVEYGCALTKAQRQALANDITKLHHEIYHVPSFFVAVKLTDGSGSENYSGGKEVGPIFYPLPYFHFALVSPSMSNK